MTEKDDDRKWDAVAKRGREADEDERAGAGEEGEGGADGSTERGADQPPSLLKGGRGFRKKRSLEALCAEEFWCYLTSAI